MLKITKGLKTSLYKDITPYMDDRGNEYVRVAIGDDDFCLAAHDYAKDGEDKFTWNEAMRLMKQKGLTLLTKEQSAIYVNHLDEINNTLKDMDGDALKETWYWTSTECGADNASVYFGTYGNLDNVKKSYTFMVRPVLNLK